LGNKSGRQRGRVIAGRAGIGPRIFGGASSNDSEHGLVVAGERLTASVVIIAKVAKDYRV